LRFARSGLAGRRPLPLQRFFDQLLKRLRLCRLQQGDQGGDDDEGALALQNEFSCRPSPFAGNSSGMREE
jgi:hypothetical protein